jgi:hypothetical protein
MGNYQIVTRAEWGAAPPKAPLSPMTQPDGWVVHYVGALCPQDPTLQVSEALCRQLQADAFANTKEGYIDIPYSFQIDLNGRIFEGRGFDNKSAANGSTNYNAHAWAVCVLMGPAAGEAGAVKGNVLTTKAKDALTWLTQEGARRRAAVSYVKGHRDVYATHCPGDQTYAYVPTLNAHLHDPQVAPTVDWAALKVLYDWGVRISKPSGILSYGQTSPDVKILNDLLIAKGYLQGVSSTNHYSINTVNAVKVLKVSKHLPNQDGTHAGAHVAKALLS